MSFVNYELLGKHYSDLRQPDQKIEQAIFAELDGLNSILNIGAGAGSYEPSDKQVVAVEPSSTMIAQRPVKNNTRVYRASAENLPFESDSFDAALAILTIHHWSDWRKGLREALRVVKNRVILLTWTGMPDGFWLFDYFPEIEHLDKGLFPSIEELSSVLGAIQIKSVPVSADCTDGFLCAYWARPEYYLDPRVRSAISTFSRIAEVDKGVKRLSNDIENGEWYRKYSHLKGMQEMDYGYRIIVKDKIR